MARESLKEQLSKGQVFCPCVWGCFSALAAEKTGFQSALLSGASLSVDICGLPDIGLITADDLVKGTEALARYTDPAYHRRCRRRLRRNPASCVSSGEASADGRSSGHEC